MFAFALPDLDPTTTDVLTVKLWLQAIQIQLKLLKSKSTETPTNTPWLLLFSSTYKN